MIKEYSENILVQESAGNLLKNELGWDVVFAYDKEVLGVNGTLGRKNYKEILLLRYLKEALVKLNSWITETQIEEVVKALKTVLSTDTPMQTNEKIYKLIRDGVKVSAKKPNGQTEEKTALLIDYNNPTNNHFLAVKEMKIHGELYRRRTDIVGYVNGLPLLFVELKATDVDVKNAYTDNYTDYQDTIPHLFYYNAFLILSNGPEAKVGTLGSKWEFFHEWKRLKEEDAGNIELPTMLRGICKKENFIDLLENFILYDHREKGTAKILARNHQYLGVNEAVAAYANRKLKEGKLGVFWHTQGSGKSYSMLFLSQKINRKFAGSPTIVVMTDRDELNTQISETFARCGLLGDSSNKDCIATSGADLVKKLKANPSYIFTLIQKFNRPNEEPIHTNYDIIVMSDEAHRSQYGTFAENLVKLLPECSRIGFTGTPLLSDDNITERTFGGYVSIYDFKRAVDDHATVPLFYESRGQELGIAQMDENDPELNNRIAEAIEQAEIDPSQQEKLEAMFANEIHLLTAESRFDTIAKDFVKHYSDLWTSGKAMFVCMNKVSCVRMYNLVQNYWAKEIESVRAKLQGATQQETLEIEAKLKWMEETEMCVVISQEQNEIQTFNKWGLNIEPHRKKMEKRHLDREFKQADNPFRVVFVCAMWLTGFDVESLSCLYLDKPLKAHTLMQTIARANRVSEGKSNGLIVDYIGIVKALRSALADYTANGGGSGGTDPTVDKTALIERAYKIIADTKAYLAEHNFSLDKMIAATDFDKMELLLDGANKMCATIEIKKTYQTYAYELIKLFKYVRPNEVTEEAVKAKEGIVAIYKQLQKKRKHADNTDLMIEINRIVNEYVEVDDSNVGNQGTVIDISKIDFDILKKEFAKKKNKNLALNDIQEEIQKKLDRLMLTNPKRVNYYQTYKKIIEDYNTEHDRAEIEKVFMELMAFVQTLDEEEKRYVREGFTSDEELTIYDLLFRENLSKNDIAKIKKVSVDLLKTIKDKIASLDHWTDKDSTKAEVNIAIRDLLWNELPESYSEDDITLYREKIFEYVYTRYKEVA